MRIADRISSFLLFMPPWLLSAVALTLLLFLTLIPAPDVPSGPDIPGLDKIVHFLMFGLTATALTIDVSRHLRRVNIATLFAIAVGMSLLGASIEWLQEVMQQGRSAELADLIADVAGSFLIPPCFIHTIRRVATNPGVTLAATSKLSPSLLRKVRDLYLGSFPVDERRPWDDLESRLTDPDKQPQLLTICYRGRFAGFLTLWHLDDSTRYIEHFAVRPQLRGHGIGSLTLSRLIHDSATAVVLEAEPSETSRQAASRIAFYERNGFTTHTGFNYIQPPYSPDLSPVRLTLMSANLNPSDSDLKRIATLLHRKVYHFSPTAKDASSPEMEES